MRQRRVRVDVDEFTGSDKVLSDELGQVFGQAAQLLAHLDIQCRDIDVLGKIWSDRPLRRVVLATIPTIAVIPLPGRLAVPLLVTLAVLVAVWLAAPITARGRAPTTWFRHRDLHTVQLYAA
ncbi:hypothetical protein GCM10025762_35090 [Haloechinothrix salitolerans]